MMKLEARIRGLEHAVRAERESVWLSVFLEPYQDEEEEKFKSFTRYCEQNNLDPSETEVEFIVVRMSNVG